MSRPPWTGKYEDDLLFGIVARWVCAGAFCILSVEVRTPFHLYSKAVIEADKMILKPPWCSWHVCFLSRCPAHQ